MIRFLLPPHARRAALQLLVIPVLGALATQTAVAQTSSTIPFTAKLTIDETITPGAFGGPCYLIGVVSGAGTATQLGRVTASSEDCINPRGNPSAGSFSFHNNQAPSGVALIGEAGDQLYLRYSGTLTPRSGQPHRISGLFVVTGGTGHYVGATGGGIVDGSEDVSKPGSGHGQVTLTGLLSY